MQVMTMQDEAIDSPQDVGLFGGGDAAAQQPRPADRVEALVRRLEEVIGTVERQQQEVVNLRSRVGELEAEKQALETLLADTSTRLDALIGRLEGLMQAKASEGNGDRTDSDLS